MDLPILTHNCNSNHDGSSGSMESSLCYILLEKINNTTKGWVSVGTLVTDDDSTLRSHCRSETNSGKLQECVVKPRCLADSSYRVKVMVKSVFALVSKTKHPDEVKHIDALRLRKYTSCYIMKNRHIDFRTFSTNYKAPLEHLFDNNEFCDTSWCWVKEIDMRIYEIIMKSAEKRGETHHSLYCN